jgi:hypothetical protein
MNPKLINNLGESLKALALQMKKQQDTFRAELINEVPEFVGAYDELMNDIWNGRKKADDVKKFMAKYEHALKRKK